MPKIVWYFFGYDYSYVKLNHFPFQASYNCDVTVASITLECKWEHLTNIMNSCCHFKLS